MAYFRTTGGKVEVQEFQSGENLLADIEEGFIWPDLIFLDIYMGELNGMDTARRLRAMGVQAPIIFLTASPDFALESYEVEASGYLLKPADEQQTSAVLQRLMKANLPRRIAVKCRRHFRYPFVDDILYLESDHKVFTSPYSVIFPTVCFVSSKYCCHSEKSYSLRSRSNSVSTFCIPSSVSSSARTFRGNASTAMHTAINAHTAKPLTTLVVRNPHFPVIALHAPFFIAAHKRFIISTPSFWKTYSAGQRLPSCMYFFSSCMPLLFTV